MRGLAIASACAVIGGCSLFTDLGGLDDPAPSTVVVVPDGGSSGGNGDSSTTIDGNGGGDSSSDASVATRYVRKLTLTGDATAATIDPGYTCCARLPPDVIAAAVTQKKMRADLGDLRIYGTNGPLDIVVDPLSVGRAEVCFKLERPIAAGAGDTYELRYGDADATLQAVNPGSFFSFYESFSGTTIDTTKWTVWGAPVVTGTRVEFRKGAEHGLTTTAATDGVPASASLEIKAEIANPNAEYIPQDAGGGQFYYWFGFQRTGDFMPIEPWAVFIERQKLTISAEQKNENGTCGPICMQPYNIQNSDKRIYRIDRHAAGTVFTYDDGSAFGTTQASGDLSIMLRSFLVDGDVYFYWVRARPLVYPEPVLVIGDEKTL